MPSQQTRKSDRPSVGIQFREVLSGNVVAAGRKAPFRSDVMVHIPDLYTFVRGARHEADIVAGTVTWKDPRVTGGPRVKVSVNRGKLQMFRKDPRVRKMQHFHFSFSFRDASGAETLVRGRKDLFDDSGFDAAGDLTTVYLELEANGNVFAEGVVNVPLGGFITQLMSFKASGGTPKTRSAAKSQFFGFMNNRLRQIYKHVPLIFRDDARLSKEEWKTLRFAATAMLPNPLPAGGPSIDDVVKKLEDFIARASSDRIRAMRFWLQQFGLIVPVNERDVSKVRGFIQRELQRSERSLIRDVFVLLHRVVALPYYSHKKADKLVGYNRPTPGEWSGTRHDLPVTRRPPDTVFDVVIAGSGPAGSLLASRLTAQGKSVLIVEAGPYVPERTIKSDELKAIAQTYVGSGLQRANEQIFSTDPGMFILQGRCVGGGGLINNAVCFMLARERQAEWRDVGFPVSEQRLLRAFRETGEEIGIAPVSERATRLNPAVQLLEPVFGKPEKPNPYEYAKPGLSESLVNFGRCWSYGLCNVGCGRGGKRNALQVHLKDAMKTGKCTLVPDAEATDLSLNGGSVVGMHVRLRDGKEVMVRGKEYVLSCGPIASSAVLLRTTGIRKLKLPIGNRFSVNIGAPLFAFTRGAVHARPSVQIAHHYIPEGAGDGFVIESWFNPPGANAMAMPGFFDEHHFRMLQYARTVAAAPLVGASPKGKIRIDGQGAPEITLPIRAPEFAKLRRGLVMLAQSFLEGGAKYALAGYAGGRELHTQSDVSNFDREIARLETSATHRHLLMMGTGHPQGGNAMSDDPAISVVDAEFRVRGLDNLRVCDGSLFPAASGLNPQWTIFALAHLCGEAMA